MAVCRRKSLVFLFLLPVLFLSGCWDRRELNDMAIVQSAAIDKGQDNQLDLTIQVLIPRLAGNGQQGAGEPQSVLRSAKGENFADALSKLHSKLPRHIFWGHCKVYIFGERYASEGLHRDLDYLLRHPEPRGRTHLFVSEGKAANVLELQPPLEGNIGKVLRKLAEKEIGVNVTMKDFQQMTTADSGGAVLPLIRYLPPKHGEKKEETIANIVGTALFKKDRMIGKVDLPTTRGILWLRDDIEVVGLTVDSPEGGGTLSFDPFKQHTELIPKIENGEWKVKALIRAQGALVQNASRLDITDPEQSLEVEREIEKDIKERISQSLEHVQVGMRTDVFRFAEAFHRSYPEKWKEAKSHWHDIFPKITVEYDIKAKVRRPGMTTKPTSLSRAEVEKD